MLLKTAICDDDKNDAGRIHAFLEQYGIQCNVDFEVTVFSLPGEMLAAYAEPGAFHLAFLDVEMPGMNGIQLAEALRKLEDKELRIVFVSSYPRYMQDSFPVHPVHYLTKPLAYREFATVMEQIIEELEKSDIYKTLVQADGREELVNIRDILYIEAVKGKRDTLAFHLGDHVVETGGILQVWEEELAAHQFFPSHRGILLNLSCIHYLDEDTVTLLDGTVLPLSRRRSRELHARMSRRLIRFEQN